jgi:hypothetical protein
VVEHFEGVVVLFQITHLTICTVLVSVSSSHISTIFASFLP